MLSSNIYCIFTTHSNAVYIYLKSNENEFKPCSMSCHYVTSCFVLNLLDSSTAHSITLNLCFFSLLRKEGEEILLLKRDIKQRTQNIAHLVSNLPSNLTDKLKPLSNDHSKIIECNVVFYLLLIIIEKCLDNKDNGLQHFKK